MLEFEDEVGNEALKRMGRSTDALREYLYDELASPTLIANTVCIWLETIQSLLTLMAPVDKGMELEPQQLEGLHRLFARADDALDGIASGYANDWMRRWNKRRYEEVLSDIEELYLRDPHGFVQTFRAIGILTRTLVINVPSGPDNVRAQYFRAVGLRVVVVDAVRIISTHAGDWCVNCLPHVNEIMGALNDRDDEAAGITVKDDDMSFLEQIDLEGWSLG